MIKQSINEVIKQVVDTCTSWVRRGEDGFVYFMDPIDGKEISAHYGATHAAASFIIYGEKSQDSKLAETGYMLLESIIDRWENIVALPEFHNDFNNFSLCIIWDYLNRKNEDCRYCKVIKKLVLSTPDSINPTVNWFPMRWYVNFYRYLWTNEQKYKLICDKCRTDICAATYDDGFIDDRLPIGLSFNLQYDIATVAVMQFLRSVGEKIDISLELGALLNIVAPDGDINYIGRGTNQIFAWGLWVYLLASAGKFGELEVALCYLKTHLPCMLKKNNIMLNTWDGKEKYMWWDYHYCSVYIPHLLLWLIMADEHLNSLPVQEKIYPSGSSGIRVYKSSDYFIVTFAGRKEYLCEKGPSIAAVWVKKDGMLSKGEFGPWQGLFGNKYSPVDVVLRNYFGLIEIKQNKDFSKYRYLNRLIFNKKIYEKEFIKPIFTDIEVQEKQNELEIIWRYEGKNNVFLNCPLIKYSEIDLIVDSVKESVHENMRIRNQYAWVSVIQSDVIRGSEWKVRISL